MTVYSAPCWARCLLTCCRSETRCAPHLCQKKGAQLTAFTVSRFYGLLLFHFAETECEVAGHQPEDICQVSAFAVAKSLLTPLRASRCSHYFTRNSDSVEILWF